MGGWPSPILGGSDHASLWLLVMVGGIITMPTHTCLWSPITWLLSATASSFYPLAAIKINYKTTLTPPCIYILPPSFLPGRPTTTKTMSLTVLWYLPDWLIASPNLINWYSQVIYQMNYKLSTRPTNWPYDHDNSFFYNLYSPFFGDLILPSLKNLKEWDVFQIFSCHLISICFRSDKHPHLDLSI